MRLYSVLVLLVVAACGGSQKKIPEEVSHQGEGLYRLDTMVQAPDSNIRLQLSLVPIPYHFIIGREETETAIRVHIYEDLELLMVLNGDTTHITKNDLVLFVNEEFLNEARLTDVRVLYINPDTRTCVIEFGAAKPLEHFAFRFSATLSANELHLDILDE